MTNAVTVRGQGTVLPQATDWATMRQMADVLLKSGFLPAGIKTPEAAVAIILKGTELGIPPMYALSNIVIIQGKPTANAELMLALLYRDHGDAAVQVLESTAELCTVSYARRGWTVRRTHTFTVAEAKAAGLLSNQTWQKYPAAMCRARCISAVARMAFPDSIAGLYTGDELGAAVRVDADGVVEVVAEAAPEPPLRARAIEATESPLPARSNEVAPNFSGFCGEKQATRIREIAPGKGIDLSGLVNQPLPWRVIINAIKAQGGAVTVAEDGGISVEEVGKALLALPDQAQTWDEVEAVPDAVDPDRADWDEEKQAAWEADVDRQTAERRAAVER